MAEPVVSGKHQARPSVSDSSSITAPSLIIDDGTLDGESELVSLDDVSLHSSTRSLNPSEYQSIVENGRTYHKFHASKSYGFPNDEAEQERMDLQHYLYLHMTQGRLYLAPIPNNPDRVLDVGTGTGIWAIDFAQQHPQSQVIGTDLSPMQPPYVPENCTFEIDDAEDEWTFSRPFAFIHARGMWPVFRDPAAFIRQAYNHLTPGGWLEIQDPVFPVRYANNEVPEDCAMERWFKLMLRAAEAAGRPYTNTQHYKRWFEEAGFEEVEVVTFFWVSSPWAKGSYYKIMAEFAKQNARMGIVGVSLRPLTSIGMKVEEIHELCEMAANDFGNVNIKGYVPVTFTFGRKPLSSASYSLET